MTILAYIVGGLAVLSGFGVIASSRTIYSALSLVANMICLAVLFLLLNAQFLAAVQVIIYAGAVMVLFVFIIALLSPGTGTDLETQVRSTPRFALGIVAVAYIGVQVASLATNNITYNRDTHELRGVSVSRAADPRDTHSFSFTVDDVNQHGNVQTVGGELFTTFLLPFEITSLLLFVAAVGAVYLTRRPETPR